MRAICLSIVLAISSFGLVQGAGTGVVLSYHEIQVDNQGMIVPWYSPDPGIAYDHDLALVWGFWRNMSLCPNGVPYYLQHQVWSSSHDSRGLGGDQLAMALSSWSLLYAYSGDPAVVDNMKRIADYYLDHSLSAAGGAWPLLPYPYNTVIHSGVYDGDMVWGRGTLQPDKAASFAAELVTLYEITGIDRYVTSAVAVADTLAARVTAGDATRSPWPYRVDAGSGAVKEPYTTNWTGALRLFDALIRLQRGNVTGYATARGIVIAWLRSYPLQTNLWGPFFEDTSGWSDTETNADTFAWYVLEHPSFSGSWLSDARSALNWSYATFANHTWSAYGVTAINEQTGYQAPGNSHTSRHWSTELLYAEKSGDASRKADGVRGLNWATYMVDVDGRNRYPNDDIWLTDGYGDYVRHYLRAMGSAPELAPAAQNHLLRSTSVVSAIAYLPDSVSYTVHDAGSREVLRLAFRPLTVTAGGVSVPRLAGVAQLDVQQGYTFEAPGDAAGVLRIRHDLAGNVSISAIGAPADTTPPVRSNGGPTGTLPAGTTQATLQLTTDEPATCRYAPAPGVDFALMPGAFTTTGGTAHATTVSGLSDGVAYAYYVRCVDAAFAPNANTTDFVIGFGVEGTSPVASFTATPTSGEAPLDVTFDGTGSHDPDGDPVSYDWDFGDGTPHASDAIVTHTYVSRGLYEAALAVRDPSGDPGTAGVRIDAGALAVSIVSPASVMRFRVGQPIALRGIATDDAGVSLPDSSLRWTVTLHHGTQTDPFMPETAGNNLTITAPAPADLPSATTTYLEIRLEATDPRGITRSVVQSLLPHLVDATFLTTPGGLRVTVNGSSVVTPRTLASWEGYPLSVAAPAQTDGGGLSYAFASWSDGGSSSSRTIVTPSVATVVGATFTATGRQGLVAAYGFDEGAGLTTADASGNGNGGTVTGAAWVTGRYDGRALSFNGTNNYVAVADSDSLDLHGAMTLEAWVNPRATTSWRNVLMKERPGHLVYALYASTDASRPSAEITTDSNLGTTGSAQLPLNAWSHLAATYDGATLTLYLNGAPSGVRSVAGLLAVSSGQLRIGGNSIWGEYFNGVVDDVRIFNRALTQAEIQADLSAPVGGGGTPLPRPPPPGVPDGAVGSALHVAKVGPEGSSLAVSWDTTACAAAGYQLVYGSRSQFPNGPGGSLSIGGGECGIASPFAWTTAPDPGELLWFVVVANDGASTEGSWGKDDRGVERTGPNAEGASGVCGMTGRSLANGCGH